LSMMIDVIESSSLASLAAAGWLYLVLRTILP
jgi:hypothetical protein